MNPNPSLKQEPLVKAEKRQLQRCQFCNKIIPSRWDAEKARLHRKQCEIKTPQERKKKKTKQIPQKLKKEPEPDWHVETQQEKKEDTYESPAQPQQPSKDAFAQFSHSHFLLNQTPVIRHISNEPLFSGSLQGENLQQQPKSTQVFTQDSQHLVGQTGDFEYTTGLDFLKRFACHLQKRCPFCACDLTLMEPAPMRAHFINCEKKQKAMQNESRRQSAISSLRNDEREQSSNLGMRRAVLKETSNSLDAKRTRKQ